MATTLATPRVTGRPATRPLRLSPSIERKIASLRRADRHRQLGVADFEQYRLDRVHRLLDGLYERNRTPPPLPAAAAAVPGSHYTRMTFNSSHTAECKRPGETHVLHRSAAPRAISYTPAAPTAGTRRSHQHGECLVAGPDGKRLWCRACAATYLGLTSKTLANWAYEASPGPTVRGRKGTPRYLKSDLDRWIEDRC